MKKYIMFLLPWYISFISLLIFNISIPLLFILIMSFLYFYITKYIVTNYRNNNDFIFNLILIYLLNIFIILLLFYYNNYIVSIIIGLVEIFLFYKIKNV